MAEEPRIRYRGATADEVAFSIQMFTIGRSILQRFGPQMTEDERQWINIALRFYVMPPEGETGGVEPVQETTGPSGGGMERPPHAPPRKNK